MNRLIFFAVFLVSTAVSRADLTIVNEIKSDGQTQEMVMKLKGKQALVQVSDQMSVLVDGATGDSIMLMHAQKKAMKISGASVKGMLEQLAKQQAAQGGGDATVKLEPNGKSETINGYKTEGYNYKNGAMEAEYFLATDFPDLKDTLAQLQAYQSSGVNNVAGTAAQIDVTTFPGFPIRAIVRTGDKTVTSTVKSVDRTVLPATTFELPAGYETMALPTLPNMKP